MAKQLNEQAEQIQKLEETVPADVLYNQNPRLINYYYRYPLGLDRQIIFDAPPTRRIAISDILENQKAAYAIGVNGNSMEPVYYDGDTLLIEMTEEIQPGDIGIFLVNGESYIKKLGDLDSAELNQKRI